MFSVDGQMKTWQVETDSGTAVPYYFFVESNEGTSEQFNSVPLFQYEGGQAAVAVDTHRILVVNSVPDGQPGEGVTVEKLLDHPMLDCQVVYARGSESDLVRKYTDAPDYVWMVVKVCGVHTPAEYLARQVESLGHESDALLLGDVFDHAPRSDQKGGWYGRGGRPRSTPEGSSARSINLWMTEGEHKALNAHWGGWTMRQRTEWLLAQLPKEGIAAR